MSEVNPFEVDLSKINYMQLAEWLVSCYSEVEKMQDESESEEQYFERLALFEKAWEQHYEQNTKLYRSKKFALARIFITYKNRLKLKVDYGKGRTSIETIPCDTYSSMLANDYVIWKSDAAEIIEQNVSAAYQKILDVFNPENRTSYKAKLHEIVSEQAFMDINIKVRAEKDKKKFKAMSYKEFIAVCEKDGTYELKTEKHEKRSNYNAALDDCGVASTTYHEFQGDRTCHKDFDKKFFVNLAFALALPYQCVAKLLAYNGYTLNSVGREFDEICKRAFRLGYSQKLTIEVIKMKNAELAKSSLPFNPVPNLEKATSGKRKTK